MDKNTTEYNERYLRYKEKILKKNMDLDLESESNVDDVIDDEELDQIINHSLGKQTNHRSQKETDQTRQKQTVAQDKNDVEYDESDEYDEYDEYDVYNEYDEYDEDDRYADDDEDEDETVATRFASVMSDIKGNVGGFVQKKRPRGPLSTMAKWAIALVVVSIIFICVTAAYLKQNAKYIYNQMDIYEIAEEDLLINEGVKAETKGYRTFALYGVDSRESNLNQGTNSDCIIIVSINNDTKEVKLVSVYRDTLFKIQNDTKPTHKVNYAYQSGGALVSINTLNANLDLQITDYIAVDFNGMADIIDALGGVEVSVEKEEINNLNKNLAEQISLSGKYSDGIYEAGIQTLKGQQAVAYSRIRNTGLGDITRTERQREVLLCIADKLLEADPVMITHLLDVSYNCISTSFSRETVEELLEDMGDYKISGSTGFPFAYSSLSIEEKGNVLVAADMSTNVEALHDYLYGNASYTPSETVAAISDEIKTETGVQAQTVDTVDNDNLNSDHNDNAGSDQHPDGATTLTEPPEGMIVDE